MSRGKNPHMVVGRSASRLSNFFIVKSHFVFNLFNKCLVIVWLRGRINSQDYYSQACPPTNLPRTLDGIGTESLRIKSPGKPADHTSVPIENHRDKGGGLRVFSGIYFVLGYFVLDHNFALNLWVLENIAQS